MKIFKLFLIGILLVGLVEASHADILDFEGLTTSDAESLLLNNQGYGGFMWDSGWYLFDDNYYSTPAHSGNYGIVNNYGTDPIGLSIISSSSFNFMGAWVAAWDFNAPSQIKAQGFDQFDNLIGETDWLTISSNANTFLEANFTNVYRINFVGGQYFTIDDFTFEPLQGGQTGAPVPEPGTMVLMGLGFISLVGIGRKKIVK